MSRCVTCGANRVTRKMVWERDRDQKRVTVPAFVCAVCGERVFDLAVLAELDGPLANRMPRNLTKPV